MRSWRGPRQRGPRSACGNTGLPACWCPSGRTWLCTGAGKSGQRPKLQRPPAPRVIWLLQGDWHRGLGDPVCCQMWSGLVLAWKVRGSGFCPQHHEHTNHLCNGATCSSDRLSSLFTAYCLARQQQNSNCRPDCPTLDGIPFLLSARFPRFMVSPRPRMACPSQRPTYSLSVPMASAWCLALF